jgi:hypothetical protein
MENVKFTAHHPKLNKRQACLVDENWITFADGTRVPSRKSAKYGLLPAKDN